VSILSNSLPASRLTKSLGILGLVSPKRVSG
jgi:hypothetical protein